MSPDFFCNEQAADSKAKDTRTGAIAASFAGGSVARRGLETLWEGTVRQKGICGITPPFAFSPLAGAR